MLCQIIPRAARSFFSLAVVFALALVRASATSVIAPTFDQLVQRADLIFTGQVLSRRAEWRNNGGQKSIVTLVTFGVRAVHKGRADATVTLQFLGGTVGDVTLDVSEMPKFKPDERVVLFVEKNGVNASPLLGFYHGKFSLRRDANGRESVLTHAGEPLVEVAEMGRAKRTTVAATAPRAALSHEEFTGQVRERLDRNVGK